MKKYKNGLVLGKFFPVTLGHKYLIDTAIENCEHVNVIISYNPTQKIPGIIRYEAIKETYKFDNRVSVYQFDDSGLPQHDYECDSLDEFYSYWIPEIFSLVEDLDVVFTSEDYGEGFAKYLSVDHFLVDKERVTIPISGTLVRDNPFKHWDFIADQMKYYFVKRIAIMGPESVGKSTITKKLAGAFNTNFVEEYGRLVYEANGNKVTKDDFIPISEGRQSLENWLVKKSNKIIFCDTEDITTLLFLPMYCKDEDYQEIEEKLKKSISLKNPYDLYILLKPDCDTIQDGTRNFLEERVNHYETIKKELKNRNLSFVEVGGDWDQRFSECVKIIKNNFNI
jgi:HTH-type transcriptional repressor of NAD biosynthesis genes